MEIACSYCHCNVTGKHKEGFLIQSALYLKLWNAFQKGKILGLYNVDVTNRAGFTR